MRDERRALEEGKAQAGVTLVEIMVVVAMIAILIAVALPALTRDDSGMQITKYSNEFARDVQRARMEAISSRQDRAIWMTASSYQLGSLMGSTFSVIYQRRAPVKVQITDVKKIQAVAWAGYTPGTVATAPISGTMKIRFLATGGIMVDTSGTGTETSDPVSVFFRTVNGERKARLVIYRTTSNSKLYEDW
jgi:prepilin-type N-terminal cleavage/methylation domain-containing protein